MTNSNFKNKKTNSSTILTSILVGIALLSSAIVIPNIHAQPADNQIIPADVASEKIKNNPPPHLSAIELEKVKNLAISDLRVKSILNGQRYEFMSQSFVGNIRNTPIAWNPLININVSNKTDVAILVNLTNNSVVSVEANPLARTTSFIHDDPAFAIDYYTGSSTISGIYATLTAPFVSGSAPEFPLVNGIETGALDGNACNSAYKTSSWFGQAGLNLQGPYTMFTDTSFNCVVQNTSIKYVASHLYLGEVYITSGSIGTVVILDQNTGLANNYMTSFTLASKTLRSEPNTSVWWENQCTCNNWAGFYGNSFHANNAHKQNPSTGSWSTWDIDDQLVQDCSGTPQAQNVMNNNLQSGNTQTWNLVNDEVWHC
jgi:hypothetical protein